MALNPDICSMKAGNVYPGDNRDDCSVVPVAEILACFQPRVRHICQKRTLLRQRSFYIVVNELLSAIYRL